MVAGHKIDKTVDTPLFKWCSYKFIYYSTSFEVRKLQVIGKYIFVIRKCWAQYNTCYCFV